MKIIGTTPSEASLYPLDCYSILHIIGGIIGFIISYNVILFLFESFPALLLSFLCILLSSIVWELAENSIIVPIKRNRRKDDILNSQLDTACVFIGGIIGCFLNLSLLLAIYIIGGLFGLYIVLEILTSLNKKTKI